MSDEPVELNGEEKSKPNEEENMPDEKENESDEDGGDLNDIDWENRVLCSDESCIGVIGPDGRCKECGLPYEKEAAVVDIQTMTDSQPDTDEAVDDAPTFGGGDDWENRTLCSDESCIGVIGSDGRCKECGKPFAG